MKNFGKIKNIFNELVSEGIATKDAESINLFKKYVKTIKENEILKTQFLVISNIENKIESNREKATEFVKENIALFSYFDKKRMVELNTYLAEFITLCDKGDLLKEDLDYNHKSLHENISTLIFTKRTPKTIDTIVEATSNVVDYILANKPKEIFESSGLPNSLISSIMVDKYNEKYSDLDESDKEILKALIDSDDVKKKEVYSKTLRECIDLINEKLKESSLDAKDKLLQVKDKLLNDKQEVNEDYTKNISKLVELRNNLK
jgi:hypothetical protein